MTDQISLKQLHWRAVAAVTIAMALTVILAACGKSADDSRPTLQAPNSEPKRDTRAVLELPIGIATKDSQFTPLIRAGEKLPITHSEVFGNAEDNQKGIEVKLSQQRPDGLEIVASVYADDLPPRPRGKLSGIVTLTVSAAKELRVKVTVTDTAFVKAYGPFPVK